VSAFFGGCGKCFVFLFNRISELLLLRNAQKRDKEKPSKTTEENQKKTEEKEATFFVMSPEPRCFFCLFCVFLNSPCYETPPKNEIKNTDKKAKTKPKPKRSIRTSGCFFFGAAANIYTPFS
jgi:hypothetical protein